MAVAAHERSRGEYHKYERHQTPLRDRGDVLDQVTRSVMPVKCNLIVRKGVPDVDQTNITLAELVQQECRNIGVEERIEDEIPGEVVVIGAVGLRVPVVKDDRFGRQSLDHRLNPPSQRGCIPSKVV